MSQTDVVIVTSRSEAFCRVAVEALLLGRAVVYPRLPSLDEYMEDGVTGLGYQVGSVAELADRIDRLGADPALRRRLGEQGRDAVRRRFTREGFSGRAAQALRRLRGAPPSPSPAASLLCSILDLLAGSPPTTAEPGGALAAAAAALAAETRRLQARMADLADRQRAADHDLAEARLVLDRIHGSAAWQVVAPVWRAVDRLLPAGTRRRRAYDRLVGAVFRRETSEPVNESPRAGGGALLPP